MSRLVDWIKNHVLRQKPSDWIKREVMIEYWTRRDAPGFVIEIGKIRFAPLVKQETFYIDKIEATVKCELDR